MAARPGTAISRVTGPCRTPGWPGRDRPGSARAQDPLGSDPLGPDPRRSDPRGSDPLGYSRDPGFGSSSQSSPSGPEYGQPSAPEYGQRGYGSSGGYRESDYGSPGGGAAGFLSPDSGSDDLSDRTQAYPPGGRDSSGSGQNGSGQNGYGQNGYGQNGYGQDSPGQNGYGQDSYSQNGYGQNGFGQNDDNQDGFGQDSPGHPGFAPEAGGQDASWQQGFGQPGYGDQGYEPQAPAAGSPRPDGSGPTDPSFTPHDYQTEAYAPGGFGQGEPFGQADSFGQTDILDHTGTGGAAQNGFAPVSSAAIGADGAQATYTQDPYRQDAYGQDGYAHSDYPQGGFGTATRQETYPQDGPGQDAAYPQPGFTPAAVPGFDGNAGGVPPAGPRPAGKPAPRLGGMRMALYLAASVIGVVAIVFLVIHLTKTGTKTPAASSSSPAAKATAPAGTAAVSYKITQAASVGSYPLNKTATDQYGSVAEGRSKVVANKIAAAGAGTPGSPTVGYYNMTSETNVLASDYQGIAFVGYNGTFNPDAVIKVERSNLQSAQVVGAGPHGGQMICGLDTSSGRDASECMWVTKTTLGQVEFIKAGYTATYPDPSKIALEVRNAVEVHS